MNGEQSISYEKEFIFLKKIAGRFQIPVHEIEQHFVSLLYDKKLTFFAGNSEEEKEKLCDIMEQCTEGKIIHIENQAENVNGLALLLPEGKKRKLLLVGPFCRKDYIKAYGITVEFAQTLWNCSCTVEKHNISLKKIHPLVEKATEYIENDISKEHTLRSLSKELNTSSGYLSKLFHQETGMTLTEYVNRKKIAYGAYLLCTTDEKITSIAFMCGVKDGNYFARLFKKFYGMTPLVYRKQEGEEL